MERATVKIFFQGCNQDCFNCPYPDCYAPTSFGFTGVKKRNLWSDDQLDFIKEHVELTTAELAAHFGVTAPTIRNVLRRHPDIKEIRGHRKHELSMQS